MSWRRVVEPHASAWRLLAERARDRGLVHALDALDLLTVGRAGGPADVADLAADMVRAGALEPVGLDERGHARGRDVQVLSSRAIRGCRTPDAWAPALAHLWTYQVPRAPADQ